ncbi:MAG: family 2 glycosyl transferase [Deltaproteobacteria bacterium]|nr:MAG: family 2 glycosyl transferase [Deltaproteobacteria bacterium]
MNYCNKALIGAGSQERRRRQRVPLQALLSCTNVNSLKRFPRTNVHLLDSSASGGCIRSSVPLNVGDWIQIHLGKSAAKLKGIAAHKFIAKGRITARIVRIAKEKCFGDGEKSNSDHFYGISYAVDLKERLSLLFYRQIPLIVATLFLIGVLNALYLKSFNIFFFWYQPLFNSYSLFVTLYILSRFFLAVFYRPPKDVNFLPSISVVVACKNEEDSIRKTIDCIYESDYPPDLMEVIAINDGSTDNTLHEMRLTAKDHPGFEIINFEKNLGKRHGMAAGARKARGEILIYIDSDSFVQPNTLKKLVQGFSNPEVGAVCGHANVASYSSNMLTKMQQVRYFVAFRVIKASESIFSTVSCCSGCLAAYRRKFVMDILDVWLNQSFLGVPATFGDDRSLTNFMLHRYRVLYDSQAICTTIVPDRYYKFFKQQLRWKKSWIRETFIACKFMWRRHPLAAFFFYSGAIFPVVAPIIVLNALVLPLIGPVLSVDIFGPPSYLYVYGAFLMAVLYSLVYLLYYRDRIWIYGVAFSFFYMLVLVWQTYYAIITVRDNRWGTR